MCRLIESIKLCEGKFYNLPYHEARMRRSLKAVFGTNRQTPLDNALATSVVPQTGLFKCRIVYDAQNYELTFSPYMARQIRSVRLVQDDQIVYDHKFEDRGAIDRLYGQRADCDDVLIVKDGRVTDCSYSNVAFRKGARWITPAHPLLAGTMREKLIDSKVVEVGEIRMSDILSFDSFKVMNAMLEFESPEIEVSAIVF